jgi:hypothetical protein
VRGSFEIPELEGTTAEDSAKWTAVLKVAGYSVPQELLEVVRNELT